MDLVEHEVRHLGGVQALGAHIGWRTVAPGLAVGLDADSLEIFINQLELTTVGRPDNFCLSNNKELLDWNKYRSIFLHKIPDIKTSFLQL